MSGGSEPPPTFRDSDLLHKLCKPCLIRVIETEREKPLQLRAFAIDCIDRIDAWLFHTFCEVAFGHIGDEFFQKALALLQLLKAQIAVLFL